MAVMSTMVMVSAMMLPMMGCGERGTGETKEHPYNYGCRYQLVHINPKARWKVQKASISRPLTASSARVQKIEARSPREPLVTLRSERREL
jgi:hypothetical protein